MEVKIGVQNAARELTVDTDETTDAIEKLVTEAISGGGVLVLSDTKGQRTVVPADKLAYVHIGRSSPSARWGRRSRWLRCDTRAGGSLVARGTLRHLPAVPQATRATLPVKG